MHEDTLHRLDDAGSLGLSERSSSGQRGGGSQGRVPLTEASRDPWFMSCRT